MRPKEENQMIKEAKILRVTIRNPILDLVADHVGLLFEENGELVVYHNNPSPDNEQGGNIIRESLVDFMFERDLEYEETVWIDTVKFYQYVEANITREYHLLEYNCEQFITEALQGAKRSPQLITGSRVVRVIGIGLFSFLSYKIYKKINP